MIKTILENLDFPEGPAVDSKGNIWLVELHGGNIVRLGTDGAVKRFPVAGGKPNGITVDASDKIWFCDAGNDCVSVLDPDTGAIEVFCDSVDGKALFAPKAHRLCLRCAERRRRKKGYRGKVFPERLGILFRR